MQKLIPVVNRLQDVFHSVGMENSIGLPQIAVVGGQSAGKSSVLESLVGRDFLPRGTGIVTRRPLVLQLLNIPLKNNTPKDKIEWGEFLHIPNQKFYDFQQIKREIVRDTERIAGKNKGLSPSPIHLRVYSPYVLNLTVVDLPGITRVPVGDQPKDIEHQIKKMILKYISDKNTIILAVTPANSDIANSDSLKFAKAVDKSGIRTLGVLTKIDIMDTGTDCLDILQGKVIPLKKGYIGIINRGQQDIVNGVTIRDHLKKEVQFFKTHPKYRPYASKLGSLYLAKSMNRILLDHIRLTLPDIKAKISSLINQAQAILAKYGDSLTDSKVGKGATLLQLVTQFTKSYTHSIDGRELLEDNKKLFGGACINQIFNVKYAPYMHKMNASSGLSEDDIRMAIRNAKGPRSSLFVPEAAFEMLVRKQVKLLLEPSIRCIDEVYDELLRIIEHAEKELERFPKLKEKVVEFCINLLKNYVRPLKVFVRNLIDIELAYVNTNHPDFFGGGQTVAMLIDKLQQSISNQGGDDQQQQQGERGKSRQQPQKKKQLGRYQSREHMEMDIIRTLLTVYFHIVRKSIADTVPKSIMNFLVNKSKANLQSELVGALYKDDLIEELLMENEEIANKRKAAKDMLKVLRKANEIINEVRDIRM